jgi:hypothetical protein
MKLEELREKILVMNIDHQEYVVDGKPGFQTFCIKKEQEGKWEVFYHERGNITFRKSFSNEDEACTFYYDHVLKQTK